ncbi:hypothetical protein GCM10023096_60380 [Nonomuraea ferruginea]
MAATDVRGGDGPPNNAAPAIVAIAVTELLVGVEMASMWPTAQRSGFRGRRLALIPGPLVH